MDYRELGRTGLKVSRLCLGTMTFGEQNTEAEGHAQIDYAVDRGINIIDAAEIYPVPPKAETQGRTEAIIGSWIAARNMRDKVMLATKVVGRGKMAWLRKDGSPTRQSAAQIMEDFFGRISHPALTDLQIDWGGLHVSEVFPRTVPDLFVGRPVILTGRFAGNQDATIRVNGKVGEQPKQVSVPATLTGAATHKGLPSIWARMKIAALADQSTCQPDAELPGQIKQVALDYSLMSAFTAFVAVDSTRRTEGSEGTTVPVAVPVPEGVKYETTVEEQ